MAVALAPQYTQRSYSWTLWKAVHDVKMGHHQYDDDGVVYTIWFYDGPEVHVCTIWKGTVPDGVVIGGYSQQQNDLDKNDFETNYEPTANGGLDPRDISSVPLRVSLARGTGGWTPDFVDNNKQPGQDEACTIQLDGDGSTRIRGPILTDEGSFRDDFNETPNQSLTGTLSFTNGETLVTGTNTLFLSELTKEWLVKSSSDDTADYAQIALINSDTELELTDPYPGTTGVASATKNRWAYGHTGSGSITYVDSKACLSVGTASGDKVWIKRSGDYLPVILYFSAYINNRRANQTAVIQLVDDSSNPGDQVSVIFDGTDNTKIRFRTSNNGETEETIATLPSGLTTSTVGLFFQMDVSSSQIVLSVNDVLLARHWLHIPDPYTELELYCSIENTNTAAGSTSLYLDVLFFSNVNQIQTANQFRGEATAVKIREDIHSIYSNLTTTSTSSDQTILSYTVPVGRTCYLAGYIINQDGSNVDGMIKIGKNTMTTEPTPPGTDNGNILRGFKLFAKSSMNEDFSASPRFVGAEGSIIKVVVTPTGTQSTNWRCTLDLVIR